MISAKVMARSSKLSFSLGKKDWSEQLSTSANWARLSSEGEYNTGFQARYGLKFDFQYNSHHRLGHISPDKLSRNGLADFFIEVFDSLKN
jgi:hypothetical protein